MPDRVPMNRREAIRAAGLAAATLGATIAGVTIAGVTIAPVRVAVAMPPGAPSAAGVLSLADRRLAELVADTILPTTQSSPGARAARVGPVMDRLLTDCYDAGAQRRAVAGLAELRSRHPGFTTMPRARREDALRALDREALAAAAPHWFALLRELSERAYWSSEIGMTRALRWMATPGRWVGCIPLRAGQPAWG